jgi:type IV pilus assembly protein PilW
MHVFPDQFMTPASRSIPMPRSLVRQQGFSLIELMVAMAIGLVVVGAVLTNYLNNTSASRRTNALAQISSDAALAMGILRNHIAMAGFAQPTSVDAFGKMVLTPIGQGMVGCGGTSMTRTVTTTNGAPNPPTWGCDTATTPSDSLLVRYQTDANVSPLTAGTNPAGNNPMDCLGNNILANGANIYIAENNFYIDQDANNLPALYCRSGTQNEPLVENVTAMTLTFGVAAGTGKNQPIVRYVSATDVGTLPDTTGSWDAVKAVRICLVVRSAEAVLTTAEPYIGCNKQRITPTDRFMYRTFTTTIVLNNRMATI